MSFTVTRKVHFRSGHGGQKQLRKGTAAKVPTERVPRISRLMALAIHFDRLIRDGKVKDYAELARLGHVTRARVTQVMNLLQFVPDIQEALLFLPQIVRGVEPIQERDLRLIAAVPDWRKQRQLWQEHNSD